MKSSSLKKMSAARTKRAAVRFGRPPKELAGEVDTRILDAARKMFLERGFEGASIDEIAAAARWGKPTIYARFRDKRALFTNVVTRDIFPESWNSRPGCQPVQQSRSASQAP